MGKAKKKIITQEACDPVSSPAKPGTPEDAGGRTAPRRSALYGHTIKMRTGCGTLYMTINRHEGTFFELFIRGGKAGGCAASQCQAIWRLVSLAWRNGIKTEKIEMQQKGISCQRPGMASGDEASSCADAVARAIEMAKGLSG